MFHEYYTDFLCWDINVQTYVLLVLCVSRLYPIINLLHSNASGDLRISATSRVVSRTVLMILPAWWLFSNTIQGNADITVRVCWNTKGLPLTFGSDAVRVCVDRCELANNPRTEIEVMAFERFICNGLWCPISNNAAAPLLLIQARWDRMAREILINDCFDVRVTQIRTDWVWADIEKSHCYYAIKGSLFRFFN